MAVERRRKIQVRSGGGAVLKLVETLREAGRLDSLQLLHFHWVRSWPTFVISPPACANRRVSTLNCTSWASTFSASMWAAAGVDYEGTLAVRLLGELRPERICQQRDLGHRRRL